MSRTSVLIISHITFRDCRVHSFCDNISRNSCRPTYLPLRCRFIVARRWILIIKVSRYINCEGFKFLLIQSVYWNIHIICVCRILWSPLLKLGVCMCVCILNYMISRNITVYFWSPKTNNNISVLCGLVQCFYLECLCWFINEFLITTFRAITFWILDDVNDAFHFEETYLLLLIFEP